MPLQSNWPNSLLDIKMVFNKAFDIRETKSSQLRFLDLTTWETYP